MTNRVIINVLGMGFLLLIVDGCLYRDPAVKLPGGYVVAAISNSSSSDLYLERQPDAAWTAFPMVGGELSLLNNDDGTSDSATSIADIQNRFNRVDLSQVAPRLENVTEYRCDDRYVAGTSGGGFFLLDTTTHVCETWESKTGWQTAISAVGLSSCNRSDPKGLLNRWRHPATFPVYAALLILAALVPRIGFSSASKTGDRTNG